jgi:SAM-dependent methyltransferase
VRGEGRVGGPWATGDFTKIGGGVLIVGERLCEAVELHARERVLDLATENGNVALSAARRRSRAVAVDAVGPGLLHGARRAALEGYPIDFARADALRLPFREGSFDAVLSSFGVGFAPDPAAAARELLRVCRSGGRVGLAHWTDQGFNGPALALAHRYLPSGTVPPEPYLWAREESVRQLLEPGCDRITARSRTVRLRADDPEALVEGLVRFLGPVAAAHASLSPDDQRAFREALLALAGSANHARDDTWLGESGYLEVVGHRR